MYVSLVISRFPKAYAKLLLENSVFVSKQIHYTGVMHVYACVCIPAMNLCHMTLVNGN